MNSPGCSSASQFVNLVNIGVNNNINFDIKNISDNTGRSDQLIKFGGAINVHIKLDI